MRLHLLALAALASACLTPRSIMLGQTAAATGKGGLEIGVGTGVGYAYQVSGQSPTVTGPMSAPARISTVASGLALPAAEANAHFGLTDRLGLNAHFSSAGVQPGLKITLNKSRIASVALMPQVAFGYAQFGTVNNITDEFGVQTPISPTTTDSFTFMGGLKFLVSHQSGFYCGVGYDFIFNRSVTNATTGAGNNVLDTASLTLSVQHSLAVNVGFSIAVGWLRLRPEIAVTIQPAISQSFSTKVTAYSTSGGYGFAILPGFSLVAVTPKVTRDEGAEEDERNVGGSEETPPERERDPDDVRRDEESQ